MRSVHKDPNPIKGAAPGRERPMDAVNKSRMTCGSPDPTTEPPHDGATAPRAPAHQPASRSRTALPVPAWNSIPAWANHPPGQ